MKIPTLILILSLLLANFSHAKEVIPSRAPFEAVITRVADGDTFFVQRGKAELKVRLRYADAPEVAHRPKELGQPGGKEAADYLAKWKGQTVIVTPKGLSYGRLVADVVRKDTGEDCALYLVSAGWAVCDPRYHPPKSLRDSQARAMADKLGAFAAKEKPTPPWEWRKQSRGKK